MQELGHVLGLAHSEDRRDVMSHLMPTRRMYDSSAARLTERDRAALTWLYTQSEWVPILGPQHSLRPPPAPEPLPDLPPDLVPQPGFTPIPGPAPP